MKTDTSGIQGYETPKTAFFDIMTEGILCQSGGNTNEGIRFEDWN